MDFQLPKCFYCPICYEVYDEETHLPIIIPCGNGHTMCVNCVVNTWGEDGRFSCPFDKVKLYYYHGIVNELAKNRVVLDALEELRRDYCSQHTSRKLDLICNGCQNSICSACQLRGGHEGHEVVLVEEFEEEAGKSGKRIEKCLREMEEIFENIIKIVSQKQVALHEMINNKFNLYAGKIRKTREFMKYRIEVHFQKMKEEIHEKVFNQGPDTPQILAWKTTVKEITSNSTGRKTVKDNFEIIKQNKIADNLNIENWINEKKDNIKELEVKFEEMWHQLEKDFDSAIHKENELKTMVKEEGNGYNNEEDLEGRPTAGSVDVDGAENERRDEGEDEEPGSSTIPHETVSARNCRIKRQNGVTLEACVEGKKDVDTLEHFVSENVGNGSLRHLTKLNISCERLTESDTARIIAMISDFIDLTHVQLQFGWCKTITDDITYTLCQTITRFSKIIFLEINFPGCDQISDNSLAIISQTLPKLPCLTYLHLDFGMCLKIRDNGIIALSRRIACISRLLELRMSFPGCSGITDHGVIRVSDYISKMIFLENLQISFTLCKKVTDLGVHAICGAVPKCRKLNQLQIRFIGCTGLSTKGQNCLRETLTKYSNFN